MGQEKERLILMANKNIKEIKLIAQRDIVHKITKRGIKLGDNPEAFTQALTEFLVDLTYQVDILRKSGK